MRGKFVAQRFESSTLTLCNLLQLCALCSGYMVCVVHRCCKRGRNCIVVSDAAVESLTLGTNIGTRNIDMARPRRGVLQRILGKCGLLRRASIVRP